MSTMFLEENLPCLGFKNLSSQESGFWVFPWVAHLSASFVSFHSKKLKVFLGIPTLLVSPSSTEHTGQHPLEPPVIVNIQVRPLSPHWLRYSQQSNQARPESINVVPSASPKLSKSWKKERRTRQRQRQEEGEGRKGRGGGEEGKETK